MKLSLGWRIAARAVWECLTRRGAWQAMEESQEAGKLADEYQPVIVQAEKDKRAADLEFQKFAQATSEVGRARVRRCKLCRQDFAEAGPAARAAPSSRAGRSGARRSAFQRGALRLSPYRRPAGLCLG